MASIKPYIRKVQCDSCREQESEFENLVRMGCVVRTGQQVEPYHHQGDRQQVAVKQPGSIHGLLAKLRHIANAAPDRREYRVLVVDDSVLPRAAARTMVGTATGLRLVGEASSGAEALQAMGRVRADLVLMDVHMPGMDGAATTMELLAQYPQAKVIAWTVSESSDDLLRMMRAGCSGYVFKDVGRAQVQLALWAADRSDSPGPRNMIAEVLRRVSVQTPLSQGGSAITLTSREMQIRRGVAKEQPTK